MRKIAAVACLVLLGASFLASPPAQAQEFELLLEDCDAPVVKIATSGLNPGEDGAQGWSLSFQASPGCMIVDPTIDGTDAGDLISTGFELSDTATCPGDTDGAISAVVLSFIENITLDPGDSPHTVLSFDIAGDGHDRVETVLSCVYECRPADRGNVWKEATQLMLHEQHMVSSCRVSFVDGCVGSGQPVPNVVTHMGASHDPTLGPDLVCPVGDGLPLDAEILFLDGNQNAVARSSTMLGPLDLDAINVCATLERGMVPVPEAGLIQIAAHEGVAGEIRTFVGSFPREFDSVPAQSASGMGQVQCQLVPADGAAAHHIHEADAPTVDLVYVNGTEDD